MTNWVTLDGVMQGPGREDEDTRGGFSSGGWAAPYSEGTVAAKLGERMGGDYAWLLGRRSYEGLLASWNDQGGPFKEALNERREYVASRDPSTEFRWPNSVLLTGDITDAVSALKTELNEDLIVLGSGDLIASLMPAGLIDEYLLPIAPIVLGDGRRLFPDGVGATLRLRECVSTPSGAIVAAYVPED